MKEQMSAYQTLQALAESSLSAAQQLPSETNIVQQWSGIGFSLLGFNFVVPMEELVEMLEVPTYTRLPSVHSWVKGVANVRGRLLPLFDLATFFAGSLTSSKKQQRLLVLDDQHVYAGLWVDRVFGMQYFPIDSRSMNIPSDIPNEMREFLDGYYELNGQKWTVFHLRSLLQHETFLNVSAA